GWGPERSVAEVDVGQAARVGDHGQLDGGDGDRRDPADRPDRAGDRDEHGGLTVLVLEQPTGVQAAGRPGGVQALGLDGGGQLAQRPPPPRFDVGLVDDLPDSGGGGGGHRAVDDRGRAVRGPQQVAQGGDGGAGLG